MVRLRRRILLREHREEQGEARTVKAAIFSPMAGAIALRGKHVAMAVYARRLEFAVQMTKLVVRCVAMAKRFAHFNNV